MKKSFKFPEDIDYEIEEVQTSQGNLKIIKFAKFNYKYPNGQINQKKIVYPVKTDGYINIISKIKNDDFTYKDFSLLNNILTDFANTIFFLFDRVKGDILSSDDETYIIIMKTIELTFSTIGLISYNKGGLYLYVAEMVYQEYFNLVNRIEETLEFEVLKPIPRHMLGLIYANSQRYMKMLPNLGMTLIEDRKIKHKGSADRLLKHMKERQKLFLNKFYLDVKRDFQGYSFIKKSFPINIGLIFDKLETDMPNFPEHSLLFLTQKYESITAYLIDYHSEYDIFTSLLRLEFLIFLTAFIETLLKNVLTLSIPKKNQSIGVLAKEFFNKVMSIPTVDIFNYRQIIPAYSATFSKIDEEDHNFYTIFCNFVFNMNNKLKINKIDISTPEKLKFYQASILLHKTRNQFHHDLLISTEEIQISIREDIPKIFEYLSDVIKFNKIFNLLSYYLSLILVYAYNIF